MNATELKAELRPLLAVTVALMLITAVAFPLAVTGIGQALFNRQANGSIVSRDGVDIGSSLIGQSFTTPEYFHGRPSAAGAGYDAANSSGSNLGPTSAKLINGVADDPATTDIDESFAGFKQRVAAFRAENGLAASFPIPADAVTASASGLDPHVSPATARLQAERVAMARGADVAAIRKLVDDNTEGAELGFLGQERVNVLRLNLALDQRFPLSK